jgi:tetratricopeptide (TPR) repeat protein
MIRKTLALVILSAVLGPCALAQAADGDAAKLRIAGSQYEIIRVLLRKQEFSQVLPEFRKILGLQLSRENEVLVVRGAWTVVEELRKAGQYSIAHQVVDETLLSSHEVGNRFSLLMLKGKIFQEEGRLEDAIGVYRKAQQLRAPSDSPEPR